MPSLWHFVSTGPSLLKAHKTKTPLRRMSFASLLKGINALIRPYIGPRPTMASEFNVIDVRPSTLLPNKDQLLLAAIKTSHAAVRLAPHANIFELSIDGFAGGHHLPQVPPVHADVMHRGVCGVGCHLLKTLFKKASKLVACHLAACHREFAMMRFSQS